MRRYLSLLLVLLLALGAVASAAAADEPMAIYSGIYYDEATGGIYVTDINCKLIKLIKDGKTSVYAGKTSEAWVDGIPLGGYVDASLSEALFASPWAISNFRKGLAVSDPENKILRHIEGGEVKTMNIAVDLEYPTGLATDDKGFLYVSDTARGKIFRISSFGGVMAISSGLSEPTGLSFRNGTLYVCESGKNRVLAIKDGKTEVICGIAEPDEDAFVGGFADGGTGKARLNNPQGVFAHSDGSIYIADTGNKAVRVFRNGRLYTIFEASPTSLKPISPRGLCVIGEELYVCDSFSGELIKIDLSGKPGFEDALGSPYEAAINNAAEYGIIKGYPDGSFRPDDEVSVAQFFAMLGNVQHKTDGSVVINGRIDYSDVEGGEWFAPFVRWAGASGYYKGREAGGKLFADPAAKCSRGLLVSALYEFAKANKISLEVSSEAVLADFSDANLLSDAEAVAMQWAVSSGIVSGYTDGTLRPDVPLTRAQAASVLTLFMQKSGY